MKKTSFRFFSKYCEETITINTVPSKKSTKDMHIRKKDMTCYLDYVHFLLEGNPSFPQRSYNLRVNRGETQFSIMVGGTRPITIEVKRALGEPTLGAITLGHGYAGFIVKIRITNPHIHTCHLWYVATGPGQQQAILQQMLTVVSIEDSQLRET